MLNAVLLVLVNEGLSLTFSGDYLLAGLILIPYVLVVRFICGNLIQIMRKVFAFDLLPMRSKSLLGGGIRGGISVALALSLPPGPEREVLVCITYIIVLFSIAAQGLTIGALVRKTSGV